MRRAYPLPPLDIKFIESTSPLILLETNKFDTENLVSYIFWEPVEILKTCDYGEVPVLFRAIDKYTKEFYLAGFFSYELGYALTKSQTIEKHANFPLLWLGVFDKVRIIHHQADFLASAADESPPLPGYSLSHLRLAIEEKEYHQNIEKIKQYIAAGDTYQVNFTTKYKFDFNGCPYSFYQDLKKKQAVAYNAFVRFDDVHILSISPELFFRKSKNRIITRPMKGTMPRGRTLAEDKLQAERLAADEKNRSENVMIVDLMRNDLGRISKTGSVQVRELFAVEKYNSLFQMTSTIASELNDGMSYFELFKSLFPSGSVTGAPKIRTMQIIRELEKEARGVYTGAIGFISPHGEAVFNVPIRTVTLQNGRGEMGVGSGIVYDAVPAAEFQECQLKAHFLIEPYREFSLIDTILWQGEYKRLTLHIKRLRESAEYFNFYFDEEAILNLLKSTESDFDREKRYKARLLLDKNGHCQISHSEITLEPDVTQKVAISSIRTRKQDAFLFHKTTRRDLYNSEYEKYSAQGCFDVIFTNADGEITEGAISNIFIKNGKNFYTPPVECGLLNGVFRQEFLATHQHVIAKVLRLEDLYSADEVYLTNAIRGMVKVDLKTAVIAM
jgi:para-aminobenzoate synthetase/4-amino-4-deoxychorismate lyase